MFLMKQDYASAIVSIFTKHKIFLLSEEKINLKGKSWNTTTPVYIVISEVSE